MTSPTQTDPRSTAAVLRRAAAAGLWLPASGASMAAAVQEGDVLYVVAQDEPLAGEVWLSVFPDGRLVAHRVVRVGADAVRLAGDAGGVDPAVGPDLLVGRVKALRRDGRLVRVRRRHFLARQLDRFRRRRLASRRIASTLFKR